MGKITNIAAYAGSIARIRDVITNADHLSVRSICTHCGHVSLLDWSALAVGYSEEKPLRTLARNIRCKSCGARGCVWQVSDEGSASEPPAQQPDGFSSKGAQAFP